jgi:flagellar P-ring protein precursor FlgI
MVASALVAVLALPAFPTAAPVRVKDLAYLMGVAPTHVIGYGLVVGLNKTGDRRQTIFTTQSLANMLRQFGLFVPPDAMRVENIAGVMVTAELPPFSRNGGRIDVVVSSVGDAQSLQGGTLLATPMRGPDGTVMVMAQGPLTLGGFGAGGGGNAVSVNHLTVGRVPGGGMVERNTGVEMGPSESLTLSLRSADFLTATRLTEAINTELGNDEARTVDPGTVSVQVPDAYRDSIPELMARLELLAVEIDGLARVVINERTGTVVVGSGVQLGEAAVAHGSLSVFISTSFEVSQPAPFSEGETTVVPQQEVELLEEEAQLVQLEEGTTLEEVVRALNLLGATPRDIIAILQALKAAGALQAEIVII